MKEQFYFAEKSQLLTQAQLLAFEHAKSSLKIGIPKETTMQENRVALVPHSVINLTARGHEIVIESEAGLKSNYSDHEYSEAGAQIVHDKKSVFECDIILKVAPPTQEELEYFRPNQILISPLQLPTITSDYIQMLRQRRVTSLAMEYMQADDNSFPIVRTMSEMGKVFYWVVYLACLQQKWLYLVQVLLRNMQLELL